MARQAEAVTVGLDEVSAALGALAARKATMPGTAPGAAWKYGGPRLAELLHGLVQRHWVAGNLRHDSFLTTSWLHFLEKPGRTLRSPADLRPIALQPGASKVFSALIKTRLQPYLCQIALRFPQFAYVAGRGTAEAISRVAQHCSRVRSMVRGQKQDLHSKHAGIQRASCAGGCQLSIDLSRAFDSVPRSALLRALEWAGVPTDLCVLVLAWHEASVYTLGVRGDSRQQRSIQVTRGVKQGCLIAPALWTIFSCFVWSHFDGIAGHEWNSEHTTGYADDFHFRWELGSYKQCRQVGLDIDMIFSVLKAQGLQINPDKSHFLVEVRGSDAEKWLRKHKVKRKDGDGWAFRFNLFTKEEVPIAKKVKYLGVIVSYHSFEDETLSYRMDLAQAHRNRLAKVLQGRGGLGLAQRRRIWQVCVQTSQTYGLAAVGLTAAGLRKLHIQTLKHIRAFAKSPRHISRESDQDLLRRLGIANPHETLLTQLDGMIARHKEPRDLPCYGLEALVGWLEKLRTDMAALGAGDRRASQSAPARSLDRLDAQERAVAPAKLVPMPDETPQYACQVCGLYFPTLHQVKTHEGRFHKRFAPLRDLTDKASYSLDGLPTCRFCKQAFSKWTVLQRHIRLNRCPGLRVSGTAGQEGTAVVQVGESVPSDQSGPQLSVQPDVWAMDRPLTESALRPVIRWPSVIDLPSPRRWEEMVRLPGVVDYLRQHCGLCGQWIAKTNGVRKHLRVCHKLEWEQHMPHVEHWARSWSKVITRPCPVCSADVVDIRQHGGSCVVMQQAALVQLCLSGQPANERPLQSDARSRGDGDGGSGDRACATEEAQAGRARSKAKAQGSGSRQRQGQRSEEQSGGLLRFFGPKTGGKAAGSACPPPGGGTEPTGIRHLLLACASNGSSPRHSDSIPIQGGSGVEDQAGALPQRADSELETGHSGMPGQGVGHESGHSLPDTGCQEAGGEHGAAGRGFMGLSDLGPAGSAEREGQITQAGSGGGLSRPDGDLAEVHLGGWAHAVSGAEGAHSGALGHAGSLSSRCLSEGASDARAVDFMDSAGSLWPHRRPIAQVTHSAGTTAGEGLRASSQSLTAHTMDWLSGVTLGNAGNFCYSNAIFLALAMTLPVSAQGTPVGRLLGKIWRAPTSTLYLHKQGEWRQLTRAWPNPQMQHDAAEFLLHLAQQDELVRDLSAWHARAVGFEGAPRADSGRGIILLPVRSAADVPLTTLQACIQAWHEQLQLHELRSDTEVVVFQLDRFRRQGLFVQKDTTPIALANGEVLLPIGNSAGETQWWPYHILSLVIHLGQTPVSGHYRAVHYNAGEMCITDDNVRVTKASPTDRVAERVYMLFLRKLH